MSVADTPMRKSRDRRFGDDFHASDPESASFAVFGAWGLLHSLAAVA